MAARKPTKTTQQKPAADQEPISTEASSDSVPAKPSKAASSRSKKVPPVELSDAPLPDIPRPTVPAAKSTRSPRGRKKPLRGEAVVPDREVLLAQLDAEVEALAEEELSCGCAGVDHAPCLPASRPVAQAMTPSPVVLPPPPSENPVLPPHAHTVLEAIGTGRVIELIFSDSEHNAPRTFEPRQLIYDVFSQGWFIWGWDRRYNGERHHRVDQFAQVNLVEGPGRGAQGPFPEHTPANQIGGWRGGEAIAVKAVLMKQWVFAVKQAPAPFPDFRLEDGEDGKALVSFTATDFRAIARWCMQFGDGIQVMEPSRLVDRMKQVAAAWAGKAAAPRPSSEKPVFEKDTERPVDRSMEVVELRGRGNVEPRRQPSVAEGRGDHRSDWRQGGDTRSDARSERPEQRPEQRLERPDRQDRHDRQDRYERRPEPREPRPQPKEEAPKKAAKVEIRFERL